jgi:Fe2+ or Zn2+ uptake regulation protein
MDSNSDIQSNSANLIDVINNSSSRLTAPRKLIIEYLSGKDSGFTADEIKSGLPSVSRATVFRTLKLLLDSDVICRVATIDGVPRYALSQGEHHHHTVCIRCDKVGEFKDSMIEKLLDTLSPDIPGQIIGHNIEFHIVCSDCIEQ